MAEDEGAAMNITFDHVCDEDAIELDRLLKQVIKELVQQRMFEAANEIVKVRRVLGAEELSATDAS
jgi:hypothetical protein